MKIHHISFNTLSDSSGTRICSLERDRTVHAPGSHPVVTGFMGFGFRSNSNVFRCVSMACQSSTGERVCDRLKPLLSAP